MTTYELAVELLYTHIHEKNDSLNYTYQLALLKYQFAGADHVRTTIPIVMDIAGNLLRNAVMVRLFYLHVVSSAAEFASVRQQRVNVSYAQCTAHLGRHFLVIRLLTAHASQLRCT